MREKEPLKKGRGGELLKLAIFIGLGLVAGYLLFSPTQRLGDLANIGGPNRGEVKEYEFAGIKVRSQSPLSSETAESIIARTRETIQEKHLPKMLEVRLEKGPDGKTEAWVGSWLKSANIFFILYMPGPDPAKPAYFRAWYLPSGEEIDKAGAQALLIDAFQPLYADLSEGISCRDSIEPEKGNEVVECANMQEVEDGGRRGVTVRAPYLLGPDKKATIVFACFVSKELAPVYTAASCN